MNLPLLLSSFAFVLDPPLVRNQLRDAAGNPTELMPGDRLTLGVTPSGGGSEEAEIVPPDRYSRSNVEGAIGT